MSTGSPQAGAWPRMEHESGIHLQPILVLKETGPTLYGVRLLSIFSLL
jgi:hypothetical protein